MKNIFYKLNRIHFFMMIFLIQFMYSNCVMNFTNGVKYQFVKSYKKTQQEEIVYEFKESFPGIINEIKQAFIEILQSPNLKKIQYRFILHSNKEICIHPEKSEERILFKECLPYEKRLMELSFFPIFIPNKNTELVWDPNNKNEIIKIYYWRISLAAAQVNPKIKNEDEEFIETYFYRGEKLEIENKFATNNMGNRSIYQHLRQSGKFKRERNQILIPFNAIFYLGNEEKTLSFFLYKKEDLKQFELVVEPHLKEYYSNFSSNYNYTYKYFTGKNVKRRIDNSNYLYYFPTVFWGGLIIPAFATDVVVYPLLITSCFPYFFAFGVRSPNRCNSESFAP
ncbi:MAG: hypothetical protein KBA66_13700 [Leptospiraceae bacterium]|nr:hypothetical protein [Leptospiraceae bacterium]